jgi:hypothetical protein
MAVTTASAVPQIEYERRWEDRDPNAAGTGIKLTYGLLAVMLVAYVVDLVLGGPGGSYPDWPAGWGVDAFEVVAGLLVVARGVLRPHDRRYALLLGAACCAWSIGDFAMTAETLNGATPATLSLANYPWAGFFPLAYVAVMVLMQRDVKKLTAANTRRARGGARHLRGARRVRLRQHRVGLRPGHRGRGRQPRLPGRRPAAGGPHHARRAHAPGRPARPLVPDHGRRPDQRRGRHRRAVQRAGGQGRRLVSRPARSTTWPPSSRR